MTSCDFSTLVGGACGSSVGNPAKVECVTLSTCKRAVRLHLKSLNVSCVREIDSEPNLILARAGTRFIVKYYYFLCFLYAHFY